MRLASITYKLTKFQKSLIIQVEPQRENHMESSGEKPNQLLKNIQRVITLGRALGLFPYGYDYNKISCQNLPSSSSNLQSIPFCNSWFTTATSLFSFAILVAVTLNLIFGIVWSFHGNLSVKTPLDIAVSFRYIFFICWGWAIHFIFFLKHKSFQNLLQKWTSISSELEYTSPDKSLRRHVNTLMYFLFVSAILENLMLDYFRFYCQCEISQSLTECYYRMNFPQWKFVVGYHPALCFVAIFIHKWLWYTINYVDLLLAVFARALYGKFVILNETVEEILIQRPTTRLTTVTLENPIQSEVEIGHKAWVKVYQDHRNLCKLLLEMEHFFSPIIFGSFAFNLFFISLQVFDGLNGSDNLDESATQSVYEVWSIFHLLMRTGIVTICCSRINKHAHKIRDVYRECPEQFYDSQVAREDMRVTSGPQIGLSGMGCFVLKQSSLLSIISVIFTVEIILLQCLTTNTVSIS